MSFLMNTASEMNLLSKIIYNLDTSVILVDYQPQVTNEQQNDAENNAKKHHAKGDDHRCFCILVSIKNIAETFDQNVSWQPNRICGECSRCCDHSVWRKRTSLEEHRDDIVRDDHECNRCW